LNGRLIYAQGFCSRPGAATACDSQKIAKVVPICTSVRSIALALNARHIAAARGDQWSAAQVRSLLKRAAS